MNLITRTTTTNKLPSPITTRGKRGKLLIMVRTIRDSSTTKGEEAMEATITEADPEMETIKRRRLRREELPNLDNMDMMPLKRPKRLPVELIQRKSPY